MTANFFEQLKRFRRDRRGNIAVIFAIACVPLISAVGCAVDYTRATQLRSKLQAAIDAASVASISATSPAFIAAGSMTSDGPIPAGVIDATNVFNGNMANETGYTLNSMTPTVARSNGTVTATLQFSANIPTMFLGVMGKSTMTVTGSSTSTANMPLYIDFYLLLDNSPSMSVGATPADVATMVSATSSASFGSNQNCAFACHDVAVGATDNFYALAKSLGVTMRIDVLRTATQQLMTTAGQTETYSNQFRMAIYDFGTSADTAAITTIFPLSSSLTSAQTAAGAIDVMTVNGQNDQNDQDTNFDTLLGQMNTAISAPGPGTSSAPEKYLFFVSDGVADESNSSCLYTMTNSTWGNIAPRCQEPINTALCTTIKNRGVKIAVLYTTYLALPTNSWYNSWIAPFNVGPWGPSPNSQIALNMESCASPGLYFEVSPTQGISAAMSALFQKAVADARISN
jgi:Flp pilus assembly protein TadG